MSAPARLLRVIRTMAGMLALMAVLLLVSVMVAVWPGLA